MVAVVAVPHSLRLLGRALQDVGTADPRFLVAAGLAFAASAVGSGLAWHAAVRGCGASAGRSDVLSRYAVGSLVNTAAPAPAGEATRVALIGRLLEGRGGLLAAAGVMTTVAVVRLATVAALAVVALRGQASAPVLLAGSAVLLAAVAVVLARRGRPPAVVARVAGWVLVSTAAKVAAAAACCAALGVGHALATGLVVVPALELAQTIPLTPANIGVTSAAVTLALHREHVPLARALSAGIVLHAVETVAGCLIGAGGLLAVARPRLARRLVPVVAALVVAAAIGAWAVDLA